MPEKRYSKVEEEIIQILDRLEDERPATSRPQLRVVSRSAPSRRLSLPRPRLGGRPAWIWLGASFALAVAAYALRDVSGLLVLALAIASICAFFAPLFTTRGPGGPPVGPATKTWRGQDITLGPPPRESAATRARRWLDERRGRPRRFR